MPLTWTDALDGIDWNEVSRVLRLAPLADKPAQDLRIAFGNSLYRRFVFEEGQLVAVGRALADGIDVAYICDVAVLPGHQGRGIGDAIVRQLLEATRGHRKVLLYAAPGKEGFYRRFGFRRMSTAMAIFENQDAAARRGYLAD